MGTANKIRQNHWYGIFTRHPRIVALLLFLLLAVTLIYAHGDFESRHMSAGVHNINVESNTGKRVREYIETTGKIPLNLNEITDENKIAVGTYRLIDLKRIHPWPIEVWRRFMRGETPRCGHMSLQVIADKMGNPEKLILLPPFPNNPFGWRAEVFRLPAPPYKGKKIFSEMENLSMEEFSVKYGHLLKKAESERNF